MLLEEPETRAPPAISQPEGEGGWDGLLSLADRESCIGIISFIAVVE